MSFCVLFDQLCCQMFYFVFSFFVPWNSQRQRSKNSLWEGLLSGELQKVTWGNPLVNPLVLTCVPLSKVFTANTLPRCPSPADRGNNHAFCDKMIKLGTLILDTLRGQSAVEMITQGPLCPCFGLKAEGWGWKNVTTLKFIDWAMDEGLNIHAMKMIVLTMFEPIQCLFIFTLFTNIWSKTSLYFGFWWGTTVELSLWGIY